MMIPGSKIAIVRSAPCAWLIEPESLENMPRRAGVRRIWTKDLRMVGVRRWPTGVSHSGSSSSLQRWMNSVVRWWRRVAS